MIQNCESPIRSCYGNPGISRKELLFVIIGLISFVAFSAIYFSLRGEHLFYGLDGKYTATLAKQQGEWLSTGPFLSMNFFQANGNFWIPLNANLMPELIIARSVSNGAHFAIIATVIYATELFVSTLFLSLCIGYRPLVGVIAGWILPIITMPYLASESLVYGLFAIVPLAANAVSISSLILGCWILIGRGPIGRTILLTGTIALLISWITFAQVFSLALYVPGLMIYGAAALIASENRHEVYVKTASAILLLTAFVTLGPFDFANGIYISSSMMSTGSTIKTSGLDEVSICFPHWGKGWSGPILVGLALAGAFRMIWRGKGASRRFASVVVVYFFVFLLIGVALINNFANWKGARLIYHETVSWPIYAIFAAGLGEEFLKEVGRLRTKFSASIATTEIGSTKEGASRLTTFDFLPAIFAAACLGVLVVFVEKPQVRDDAFNPWPPLSPEIINYLRQESSISTGEAFRGRVASFVGHRSDPPLAFEVDMVRRTGNDHGMIGLWFYNIPTLREYNNRLMSSAFQSIVWRYESHNWETSDLSKSSHVSLLESLGVRFVLTDQPIYPATWLRKEVLANSDKGKTLFLYEFPEPNLGTYTPTRPLMMKSAEQMVEFMTAGQMDYRRDFLVESPFPAKQLVPANSDGITVKFDYIEVAARSSGQSVLVVPVQYSNCLITTVVSGNPEDVRVFRVNLFHTGILFSNQVAIRLMLRFGPFNNRDCMKKDLAELERLDVNSIVRKHYQ
jgi:hypothetical protein